LSPLHEIRIAEQECDIRFYTGSISKVCEPIVSLTALAMQLV